MHVSCTFPSLWQDEYIEACYKIKNIFISAKQDDGAG